MKAKGSLKLSTPLLKILFFYSGTRLEGRWRKAMPLNEKLKLCQVEKIFFISITHKKGLNVYCKVMNKKYLLHLRKI